jgi:hypothetical protein
MQKGGCLGKLRFKYRLLNLFNHLIAQAEQGSTGIVLLSYVLHAVKEEGLLGCIC